MAELVRLFFLQGQVSDLEQAYSKDPQSTIRLLFYWRDRNAGLGHRSLFFAAFHYLVTRDDSLLRLLPQVPVYGCWKDLVVLADRIEQALEPVAQLFSRQLPLDQARMRSGQSVTTAAKWFPSSHSRYGRSALTERVQALLEVTEEQMRRTYLSPLRHYLQTAERSLSARSAVNYTRATRGAVSRYTAAFHRGDATWVPRNPRGKPKSLVEVVDFVLKGYSEQADQHWQRYQASASAVGLAVVCDPRVEPCYPIALALAAGKAGMYTYSSPSLRLTFPSSASLALRVASLAASRAESSLSLDGIDAACVVVVTGQEFPTPLPVLAREQRLLWWRSGGPVAVIEHSPYHIEIRGFSRKIFSALSKGQIPSLAHIVASTLTKYHAIV
jgi:hypothetical protein